MYVNLSKIFKSNVKTFFFLSCFYFLFLSLLSSLWLLFCSVLKQKYFTNISKDSNRNCWASDKFQKWYLQWNTGRKLLCGQKFFFLMVTQSLCAWIEGILFFSSTFLFYLTFYLTQPTYIFPQFRIPVMTIR